MASGNTMRSACFKDDITRGQIQQLAGVTGGGQGNVYYVDDIHPNASDNNDGRSPDYPFDTLSQAITTAEVDRLARANDYIRNTIYVQANGGYAGGTIDGYAITALPNYTNIIGVGATPWGSGSGIATVRGTNATVGTARGLYVENIMFEIPTAGTGYYGLYLTSLFRSTFQDCAFFGPNTGTQGEAGVYFSNHGGGVNFFHCKFGTNAGSGKVPKYAIQTTSGYNFNNCLIEDCDITAATNGIQHASGVDVGSTIKNCTITKNYNADTDLAIGINCTHATSAIRLIGNYIVADDCIVHTNVASFCVDNHCIENGTGAIEYAGTG